MHSYGRPAKKTLNTFSCYVNFVEIVDETGSPCHKPDYQSLQHLSSLLAAACREHEPVLSLQGLPVTVVGFSKGVVVLNQFLHELGSIEEVGTCYY